MAVQLACLASLTLAFWLEAQPKALRAERTRNIFFRQVVANRFDGKVKNTFPKNDIDIDIVTQHLGTLPL